MTPSRITGDTISYRNVRQNYAAYRRNYLGPVKGKRFDDAIATGCWYLDLHPNKTTIGGANDFEPKKVQPEPYDIPYRSLLPQSVENL